jgi:hypothetical protein
LCTTHHHWQEILHNPRDRTEVRLVFANRTPADIILKDELDALAVRFPNFKVMYTVDAVPDGSAWTGRTGHISREVIADFLPPPQQDAGAHKLLVCGPPPMVAAVRAVAGGSFLSISYTSAPPSHSLSLSLSLSGLRRQERHGARAAGWAPQGHAVCA